MAIGEHAIVSGSYSTASITSSTNVRDVSDMLDLWAHKRTPVLNRIEWAAESGGLVTEWVSEHLGWMYVLNSAQIASAATSFVIKSNTGGLSKANQMKQIQEGTILMGHKGSGAMARWVVSSAPATGTITMSVLAHTSGALTASSKIYILGHYANEGSDPFNDVSRARSLLSNKFAILRYDIKITGSEAATDMYAVGNEPSHQMTNRLTEMQFARERSILFSTSQARTSTVASYIHSVYSYLYAMNAQDYVDISTTALTEDKVNDMAAIVWENGAEGPLLFAANKMHTRKLTQWNADRVRAVQSDKIGGHYVYRYLTDTNIEIEIAPLPYAPTNVAMLIDTSNAKLIPKKGRKLIVEPLAKVGDYKRWQLVSEYSFNLIGYNMGYHAMWGALTS